jgi:hypothetical protein
MVLFKFLDVEHHVHHVDGMEQNLKNAVVAKFALKLKIYMKNSQVTQFLGPDMKPQYSGKGTVVLKREFCKKPYDGVRALVSVNS